MTNYPVNLKKLRIEKGLKQSDVAKVLGTTQQVYSRYELGINEMPIRHLLTLSEFYGVTTDYILKGEDE